VLLARSRITPMVMFLKPLSAAIAIGTGGPFGAEGPIIATGGALGSLLGQTLHVTADERKTLLAAGAAAGMSATFNAPISSVLLAVELLLFEYRARSLVPVAMAAAVASAVRIAFVGNAPAFTLPDIPATTIVALGGYVVLGALVGLIAVGVTRAVYAVEEGFERLPVHWMWWPALGALVVGVIGYVEPRTLGVGYYNIDAILDGTLVGRALFMLVVLKFVSWVVYLGSGTSGGTLAPLFTFGSCIGSAVGGLTAARLPSLGIDPHVAALVGMAAIFAGTSHALLTSVVFAFETTRQPNGLLPLLAGCATAYLVATLLSRHSIMTVRLAQRGTVVASEYDVDYLARLRVGEVATRDVVTLNEAQSLDEVHAWIARTASPSQHQGFPVLDDGGRLVGVVTRRNLLDATASGGRTVADAIRRPAAVVYADQTLRNAADHMVRERVGRLPVVTRADPRTVIGIISRSDLLYAHARRLDEAMRTEEPWHISDGVLAVAASAGVDGRSDARKRAVRMKRARMKGAGRKEKGDDGGGEDTGNDAGRGDRGGGGRPPVSDDGG
jgi:H+/Cl- antiporter ClcA/CBS domain-containing protein